jgi:hypothetical protein
VFFFYAYTPAGAVFNTYTPGVVEIAGIGMIGGKMVNDNSVEGILKLIEDNNLEDSLILGDPGNDLKLTEVIVEDNKYYTNIDNLEFQLENQVVEGKIALFGDFPAINAGLRGSIIGIDDKKINDMNDLGDILKEYNVGDKIIITTNEGDEILKFDLVLGEYPNDPGRAIIGIKLEL